MGRLSRDARLETRDARARLKIQHEPYWRQITPGLFLGYRKGSRGGVWMVRKTEDGQKIKRTLGAADDHQDANDVDVLNYKQAHRKAIEFAESKIEVRRQDRYTIAQAMVDYMAWLSVHGKSAAQTRPTVDAHILPAFGDMNLCDLSTEKLILWQKQLVEQPIRRRGKLLPVDPDDAEALRKRKASANRIMTVLKAALNHAWKNGKVESKDAWERVKPFRAVDIPKQRYLSELECSRLLNACGPDFRELVRGALLTGCRYGELTRLRVEDFVVDAGAVLVREAKSGKSRHVPLTDEGRTCFARWAAGKLRGEFIFTRADGGPWGKDHQARRMAEACANAKIEPAVSFHDLRNTYGSLLAMRGVPLQVIAAALGHADTRMTERHYAHLRDSYVAQTIRANLPSFGADLENVVPFATA
ncbi:tyrosine-type recombinase/integrase [Methylomagnum ishizawai]|uniref:tyrosine-type recombinase/integrase n=1 Tax=Methylomagnum ishizawai TaxID=1760988 RepID=UPI001C320DF7|nr:site-specific integrase [Methylomagnum ishizawai]BBL73007.1 integrase [Methylomagnum ishizawai]